MIEKIISDNGNLIDAQCELGIDKGKEGLILHSRSGKNNPDYNDALEIILGRLQKLNIKFINIYIVSKDLIKEFSQQDREVLINSQPINLNVSDIKELRIRIGAEQKEIKINPNTKGGNPTKRLLLHNPSLSSKFWQNIISNNIDTNMYSANPIPKNKNSSIDSITLGQYNEELEKKITESNLMNRGREKRLEKVSKRPEEIQVISRAFKRNADVITAVLDRANGFCEKCESIAPFIRAKDNTPYLEVHHVIQLADGGEDSVENAIAICPNCHRELHYGM